MGYLFLEHQWGAREGKDPALGRKRGGGVRLGGARASVNSGGAWGGVSQPLWSWRGL